MNSDRPLISVITATYNSSAFLEASILSIERQSFHNFEYIIIDGNSKDGTVDIIKRYKNTVTKWKSEPDSGIYDAWNKGLALAVGEWITFLGSDDTFYPDAFSSYAEFIRGISSDVEFVSSQMHTVNIEGEITRTVGWPMSWRELIRINPVAHPGSLHRRTLFERLGDFDTTYRICGDHEFLLRAGPTLKSDFMNKVTVRMFDGGISSTTAMYKETLRAVKNTGKENSALAYRYFYFQIIKFYIKNWLRKFGVKKIGIRKEFSNR